MSYRSFAVVGFWAWAALAQNPYGRITGRVVDSGGALIPGADIVVTNVGTNVAWKAASDSQGNYEARNLIPGQYEIAVEMKGFKRYQRGPVEVRVGDILAIEIALELGALTESVTVTAEAPLLESASASMGQIIDRRRLLDLPMPSSAAMYLTQLVPGVIQTTPPSGNWQINQPGNVSNFATNGAGTQTSEYTINGVPNMRQYGMIHFQPMPEVLQEFRVQTAPFDAAMGHFTGSHVNMVTRSGTNSLHGTLTYQHNNRPLMTHPFFTNKQIYDTSTGPVTQAKINAAFPPTRMNRERATVSGPVYIPKLYNGRNRTFFTYGIDEFSRVFVPNVSSRTVPTTAERGGDFSALLALGSRYQIHDPATIAAAPNGRFSRQPLPGNVVPASRIDPVARRLLEYFPLPNSAGTADGLNNYTGSPVNRPKSQEHISRVDHVVDSNHRLFVTFQHTRNDSPAQNSSGFPLDILATLNREPGLAFTVDDVLTLRPDLVLNVRYGLNRLRIDTIALLTGVDLKALGLPAALVGQLDGSLTTLPQLTIDGFSTIGRATGNSTQTNYHYLAGNLAHNRGSHSLRFGGEFRVYQENASRWGFVSPAYTFGSAWTRGPLDNSPAAPIGQGLASFLLGLPTGGQIDRNASLAQQSSYMALFLQDDWKLSRKLTLNLGLRYEVEWPTTERFNRANRGFDFSVANPIQEAARANYARDPVPAVPAANFRTIGGLLFAGVGGAPRGYWDTDTLIFSPRAGLAWQFRPDAVLRAGYGVFFESLGADRYEPPQQGFSQSTALTPSLDNGLTFRATLANPFPDGLLAPVGATAGLKTFLGNSLSLFSPQRQPGYMQRWSLNLQRQFPGRVLLEAGYVGNRGTGLGMSQDWNAVPAQYLSRSAVRDQPVIDYLSAAVSNPFFGLPEFAGSSLEGRNMARSQILRPYPHFGSLSTILSAGTSWYHSLQVRAEKRLAAGLALQASYTWSKLMEAIQKLNASDPFPTHAVSTLDRPHHIVVSGICELPVGKGKRFLSGARGWLNQTAGGWSVQAIFQGQSGPPIGFGNVIFTGSLAEIVLPRSERKVERWFNTEAGFERNSQKQLASNIVSFPLRLTGLRSNGFNNWDLSLFKGFPLNERVTFQLRAEAQDGLNHPMFSAPNTSPASTLFGQVTSTLIAQQRVITLGARLMW